MHRCTSLTLLLLSAFSHANFVVSPCNLEVDLIYPRNLTISSLNPIPVVFALQNPLEANVLLNAQIEFAVYPIDDFNNINATGAQKHSYGIGNYNSSNTSSPAFEVGFMSNLVGLEGNFISNWTAGASNCTGGPYTTDFIAQGSGLIFTASKSGPAPDLVAATSADTCNSTESVVLGVYGYYRSEQDSMLCGQLSSGGLTNNTARPSPCAVQINSTAASSITARITSTICANKEYNTTQLNVSCSARPTSETVSSAEIGASRAVLAVAGFVALVGPFFLL